MRSLAPAWTAARVDRLRALWVDGASAADIARQLGGVSRNGVLGKLHRLGLLGIERAGRAPRAPQARRPSRAGAAIVRVPDRVSAELTPTAIDDAAIPPAQRRTLAGLTAADCRWPVGDPRAPDFFFCAAAAVPGRPYCAHHCIRAGSGYGRPLGGLVRLGR